jgi:prepilin-type N-terminal cleavage/methylation domain-containing protein
MIRNNTRGFSLFELLMVVGLLAVIMALAMPYFISYWRTSALRAGAEEFAAALNGARQVAIKENQTVCVKNAGGSVRYAIGSCGSTTFYTGGGTDSSGWIRMQNNVTVSGATDVTFTYLGAAGTAGTYTVTNPVNNSTLTVTVAASGRVTIP